MAFNEYYVEPAGSGASDLNAGSTTGAASVTSTNGDWGSVTANRFTPAGGGTPFSGVNVGDWASIYLDAAVTLVYLAQVTAVNGGGATLDFSTTAKYGTAPATGATGRSLKIGGAWANPWAFLGTGTTVVYTSTRINIKAGTYASGATTRSFNTVGSTTAILLWRGYNSTLGDIDTNNALTKPVLTWGNVAVTFSGLKQQFWNLDFQSSRSGAIAFNAQNEIAFNRCRFKTTSANAGSQVVSCDTTQGATFNYCYFEGPSVLNRLVTVGIASGFSHCVFSGGLNGMDYSANAYFVDHCVFLNNGAHGINVTTSIRLFATGCTFRGQGGDGIHFTVAGASGTAIVWCLFDTITGIGINNASGTNSVSAYMAGNDFAACAGGALAGFGDHAPYLSTTEASSPSISSSDPTFSGSSFNGASFRQDYENTGSITGTYWDIGATQRLVTGVPTILGATIAPTNQRFAPSATQTIQVAFIGGVWVDVLLVEDGTRLLQEDGTSALLLDAVVGTGVVFAPSVSTAGLAQSVTTLAIGPASQRFIPTVVPGPVAITTVAIGTATQLFIPTVAPGPVAVAGATRATTLAVNVPTVAVGAVTITTGTFAPTVLAFAPTVVPQAVTITGSTLAPTAQLFTALVSTGAIAILGVTVSSTLALFAPVLTGLTSGSTIVSGSGTFAPTVVQTVLVAHRPTSVVLNLPTVVLPAVQAVTLATLGSGVVLQVPTVAAGPIAFTAATIAPTAILQTVTVAPGPVAVTGVTLAAASQTFLPTLTQGAVAVGTPALPSTALLFVPTVVQQVLAATRASASVLFIPTVIGDRAVTTLVIGTTTQLFAPTALPSGALGGQTVPSTLVLNSPTVTVGPVAVLGTTVPTTLSVNLPSVATLTLVTGGTRLSFLQVFAPPTVTAGAVAITGQTVSSAGQVFTPNLTVGGTPVSSAFIGSTAALYAQQLIARLDGTFIASGAVLFPATVLAHQAVTGTTIPTGNARFVPSVAAGIGGATRPTTVVLTTPTVAVGPVTVLAPTLTAQAVAFAPSLGVGATSVTTGARPSTGQLFAPTVGMRVDLPFLGSADQAFALVVVAEPKVVTPLWVKTTTLFPPITLPLGELLAGTVASGSRIFPPRFVAYAPPGEVHEFVATLVRAVGVGTEVCRLVDEPVILTRTAAVTVTLDRTHETSGPVVRRDFVMDVER